MARVAILTGFAPTLPLFRAPLIGMLRAQGHEVVVAAPAIDPWVRERMQDAGAEVVELDYARRSMNPLAERGVRREFDRFMHNQRPTHVLAGTIKAVCHGMPAAASAGVAVRVAMITGVGSVFVRRGLRWWIARTAASALYRRALTQATHVIFHNPDDRDDFARWGLLARGVPVTVTAGSGVDLLHHAAQPTNPGGGILFASRFMTDKGFDEFLQAAEFLHRAQPSIPIRIAGFGDGKEGAEFERRVADGARGGVWESVGHRHDIRPDLAWCRVFVLPSWREGTPHSVLEAMAAGRAVVTNNVPGCRQCVEDGVTGLLVERGDVAGLVRAMQSLMQDHARTDAMGQAARTRAERHFDARVVAQQTLATMGLG
ncbi:MAG: glycosyltransferase family 4 protein [Planctomycetes bacterium]|nr:glycosyltransferase family 4 protein [Planctomycetota bacterium]